MQVNFLMGEVEESKALEIQLEQALSILDAREEQLLQRWCTCPRDDEHAPSLGAC